ncbi:MAG: hypothetical protein FWG57_09200 [Endomicrobia bacterium]|nr:hypothetical protein [Endomicrobiia bacterium]
MNRTKNKNNSSLAGEFAVLSMLNLRGFEASMSLGNTKSFDLFVYNREKNKSYRVEVKSSVSGNFYSKNSFYGEHRAWLVSERIKENPCEYKDVIFCFVYFSDENDNFPCHPCIYVVPGEKVAEYIKKAVEIAKNNNSTERAYVRIGKDKNSELHLFENDYLNAFKYFEK